MWRLSHVFVFLNLRQRRLRSSKIRKYLRTFKALIFSIFSRTNFWTRRSYLKSMPSMERKQDVNVITMIFTTFWLWKWNKKCDILAALNILCLLNLNKCSTFLNVQKVRLILVNLKDVINGQSYILK